MNIGIADKDRKKIADGLSHMLADTYTLYLKTHNYHWNVTGPMFNTLNLMFEGAVHRAYLGGRPDRRTHSRAWRIRAGLLRRLFQAQRHQGSQDGAECQRHDQGSG